MSVTGYRRDSMPLLPPQSAPLIESRPTYTTSPAKPRRSSWRRRLASWLLAPVNAADVERIGRIAEEWRQDERVARIVRRLDAVHCTRACVPADWRDSEPTPNRAGDA